MISDHASAAGARPVRIGEATPEDESRLAELATHAREAAGDVPAALALTRDHGAAIPRPGGGRTAHLWSALASVAAADLTVARVLEPHLDALAILEQAGEQAGDGTWGVFAAEGPGEPLRATARGESYVLDGRKHWCSLGGVLDHALVSARVGEGRQLFAVELDDLGVTPVQGTWVARGLTAVDSGPLDMVDVEARSVGAPGASPRPLRPVSPTRWP